MIAAKQILAPTTDSSATSATFDVDGVSRVVYIAPDSGEDLTEDDSFELRRVVADDPQRSILMYDSNGPIMLGANMAQFEVLIRGTYLIQKVLATTEAVGVYQTYGNDEGV